MKMLDLIMNKICCTIVAGLLSAGFAAWGQQSSFVDYANPLTGTMSKFELSTGNTYPAIARPWGMNFWTPQTGDMGNGWTYTYTADKIKGFKQTHQPSPWMNDYGQFSIMPMSGKPAFDQNERASWFSHKAEKAMPYYYSVYLADHDITVELTPTERAAKFRISYPEAQESGAYLIVDAFDKGSYIKIIPEENKIVGYTTRNSGGVPENFKNWFIIISDTGFDYATAVSDGKEIKNLESESNHAGAIVEFKNDGKKEVGLKVASSFISLEQAELNLRELGDGDFERIKNEGRNRWNEVLGRIRIEDNNIDNLRTFYSCLYRSVLFPRDLSEINADGERVHYSPYNGKVLPGYMFTDTGFWDTFRCLFPLLNLIYPDMSAKMQEGLVNAYLESGFLPEWASPGQRSCMIGNNSASVVADAYIKGIRGYDIEKLWEAVIHGANDELKGTDAGRRGFDEYNKFGYIPYNTGIEKNVARTLEYSYNDWTIYALGKALGKNDKEIEQYRRHSLNYRNVYNPEAGLMCGRDDKGNFRPDFNGTDWSWDFCEGNSIHWSFCVFHDPAGLIEIMGGRDKFNSSMDAVFKMPSYLGMESRGMIHEMREMQVMDMGQYAHGNQPIQHMVYMYNWSGQPWKTQYRVREIMSKLYSSAPDGYCGDEDNGQTSAWYVFSALGFYPVCPGTDQYIIGSPLFKKAEINLPDGKKINISAENNSDRNIYVSGMKINGKEYGKNYLTHKQLCSGGKISFKMSDTPDKQRGTAEDELPYSFSEITEK